jgi:predicted amidohydrolase
LQRKENRNEPNLYKELPAKRFQPTKSDALADGSFLVERHQIVGDWGRISNEWEFATIEPGERYMIAAAIQMESREDIAQNWEVAQRLTREAAARGAKVVAFPEVFLYVGPDKTAASDLDGEWLPKFSALAAELEIYLLAGSVGERIAHSNKIFNTSVLLDPHGKELARYRKIHLFDAAFANGRSYRESDYIAPGAEIVTAKTEFCEVGLSICYGKSAIIDPWGGVLALAPDREAAITAEIDFAYQDQVRAALPCLRHARL